MLTQATPRYPWGRPDQGESWNLEPIPASWPTSNYSHVLDVIHWYFNGLQWNAVEGLTVTWQELCLDFCMATAVMPRDVGDTSAKTVQQLTDYFERAARTMVKAIGGTKLCPLESTHVVASASTLGLKRTSGYRARPVLRCREAVESLLLQVTCNTCPSTWSWVPDAGAFPAPLWQGNAQMPPPPRRSVPVPRRSVRDARYKEAHPAIEQQLETGGLTGPALNRERKRLIFLHILESWQHLPGPWRDGGGGGRCELSCSRPGCSSTSDSESFFKWAAVACPGGSGPCRPGAE